MIIFGFAEGTHARKSSKTFGFLLAYSYLCSRKFIEVMKKPAVIVPEGIREVLLHACCAPCSSAIVEWMVQHDVHPTIFYYNPNIWPRGEYEIRKNESKRHAESLGLSWIDGDYNHEQWREGVCGLENEPERGRRCEQCSERTRANVMQRVLD